MNERGIALLATLWLVATLSVLAAGGVMLGRLARGTATAQAALIRGRWGAEGCLALVESEVERGRPVTDLDSVDLGAGVWCHGTIEDPAARVRLDAANGLVLAALVGDPGRAAALLDWLDADDVPRAGGAEAEWYQAQGGTVPRNGPALSIDELSEVRGFDSATVERLRPFVTVRGGTRIDVNSAPLEVLRVLPGLEAAAPLILSRRLAGRAPRDLDDLLSGLPASLRAEGMARYAELQGLLVFAPERLLVRLEGHVAGSALVARTTVEVVPTNGRLAILAREEW